MEVLTESYAKPDEPLRFGDTTVDFARREVRGPAGRRHLEPRVAALLSALAARPGAILTRDELIGEDGEGSDEALSQAVARLRRVLGDDPRAPRFVATVPKLGYRWIAVADAGERAAKLPPLVLRHPWLTAAAASLVLAVGVSAGAGAILALRPAPAPKIMLKEVRVSRAADGRIITRVQTASGASLADPALARLTREMPAGPPR